MALYVNGKWTASQMTGTERYASEMTRALAMSHQVDLVLVLPRDGTVPTWGHSIRLIRSQFRGVLFEQIALPLIARGRLLNFGGPAPVLKRSQIVVMHDGTPFRFPATFKRSFVVWYRFMYSVFARRRQPIITVSNFSRDELMEIFPKLAQVDVLPCGADHMLRLVPSPPSEALTKELLAGPYFVMLSTNAVHKNLGPVAKAVASAGHRVVLIGSRGKSSVFNASSSGAPFPAQSTVIETGRVSDDVLAWILQHAVALIMPSLYEGFGLPVVEAQVLGCAVICSNAASLPEVAGAGALYFDPSEPEQAARLSAKLLDNATLNEYREKAVRNAGLFTWEGSSRKLLSILGD